MPRLPLVAIIGKPNAGKSTLFNRLIGERKAIVSSIAGTTRDHVAHRIETETVDYLLIDTGGMGGGTTDADFEDDVEAQSLLALASADVILFLINGREDTTAADLTIVDLLRKKRKKNTAIIVVATKVDSPHHRDDAMDRAARLRLTDDICVVSAAHNIGIEELEESITAALGARHFEKQHASSNDVPRIAIIGKPNVGKSSIVNALMSAPKRATSPLLVSSIPGTTRDATDTEIKADGATFIFTDTAGLKKNQKNDQDIERFAAMRTVSAVEQSDVVVLVIDATEGVKRQDKRIAALAIESGKSLVILINKIDLFKQKERETVVKEIASNLAFCSFASFITCSAETREGLLHLFPVLKRVAENRKRRIATSLLNEWFEHAMTKSMGRNFAQYITQVEESPPTFVLFVKDPKRVKVSDLKFMERRLRDAFAFDGTPLRFVTKAKSERTKKSSR